MRPSKDYLIKMAEHEDEARSVSVGSISDYGICDTCGIGFWLHSGRCDHCDSPAVAVKTKSKIVEFLDDYIDRSKRSGSSEPLTTNLSDMLSHLVWEMEDRGFTVTALEAGLFEVSIKGDR